MPLDISIKLGIVENIHIGVPFSPNEIRFYTKIFNKFCDVFAWSYEEMPSIDPTIVVHEIPTYPSVKPVHPLRPMNPRKVATIKAKVENLLQCSFIYLIPLIDWVSNIVPVTKKRVTIRVCVDYHDINRASPNNNYPTLFINQIIDECAGSEIFSFKARFFGYNHINISPIDQHKMTFIYPWGNFSYKKLPFGLKNVGATVQREMSYAFHDIRHIVQTYLNDLPTHSTKGHDHQDHLRSLFL